MRYIITILLFIQLTTVLSQMNKDTKEAIQIYNSGEIDKAISLMNKIVDKESKDENWNILISMYYHRFKFALDNEENAIAVAFGNTLGVNMEHNEYTSSNVCYNDLISKCREACLYSQSDVASLYIRNFLVDYVPDTNVSDTARIEFDKAEEYFDKKDYINSKTHYKNAIILQPDYYSATIYLGDSYWYLHNMDSAIYYFRKGIEMYPDLLEPRKYLVDALGYSKRNEEAKVECINSIYIYPDQSMFMKYSDLLKRENRILNKHWVKRGCEVNRINSNETVSHDALWKVYQEAEESIREFCDSNGVIIKSNKLTKSKYLEVYSWEKMLYSSEKIPEDLRFAKEIADKGFLDCYVFISVFHYDLYNQFSDFVTENKDRIKTYIETYLVE